MPGTRKFSWLKWLVFVLIVGALAGGGWIYVKRSKNAAPELRTVTVGRGDITQAVTANGQLTPVVNVEVGSQVSGTIEKLFADFNSRVTNGQLIAQIEASTFKAAVLQADADVANARASLELSQVEARRAKDLYESRLISPSDYDKTVATLHQAEAMLKMREASLKRVQTDLERTTIYAPIDGVVISRNVEVGQTVAASFSTPRLFQIANDLAKMEIEAMVSEADVGGVEEGQKVVFTVDAFPTRKFQGVVKQVRYAPTTNQNVVTYTAVVGVDNADLKLRPGMTATASIVTAERPDALRIPNAALRFRPSEDVTVLGGTNAPGATGSTNAAAPKVASSGPFAGLPTPPWSGVGRRPTPEEREKYEASLTPEQREQYRQMRERMRARFAEGGGGGGGAGAFGGGMGSSGGPAASSVPQEGPRTQTVYVLEKPQPTELGAKPVLKAVTVKLGITDGAFTEVLSDLKEGDVVVSGVVRAEAPGTMGRPPTGSSPFGGPFGPRRF